MGHGGKNGSPEESSWSAETRPFFLPQRAEGPPHVCVDSAHRSKLCPYSPLNQPPCQHVVVHIQGRACPGSDLKPFRQGIPGIQEPDLLKEAQALDLHISLGPLSVWEGETPEAGRSKPFKA